MLTRRGLMTGGAALALGGCAATFAPSFRLPSSPDAQTSAFIMPDGTHLPYRSWLPEGPAEAVVLALHGFNDSRDAWEIPALDFKASGFAVYAPDQRGFGQAPERGRWAGTAALVADAAEMARQVRRLHPRARLVLLGESMGGAVLMCLATGADAPQGGHYVLVAPAVWGRATMNVFLRSSLWLATTMVPTLAITGAPVHVTATDNHAALVRLSRDPLTLHATRIDTLHGLVDLMDAASASAAAFTAPGLFLYGGRDELVPKGAMAAMWRRLPAGGAQMAYYPGNYHLMLRDLSRAVPIGDVEAWVRDPQAPLASGADRTAAAWLARQT